MGGHALSLPLVGRERELVTLTAALNAAQEGRPTLALLAGEAGIGKTRLVRALETAASERGFVVRHGDCIDPGGADLPYAPVVAALRDIGGVAHTRVLADLGPDAVGELARLLPGLSAGQSEGADHGSLAQTRLFELLVLLLRRMSEDRPVAFVLEDLHWADESTRTFLSFLARTLRRERIVAVATYRTDDVHRSHPLRKTVTELCRLEAVERLQLAPLDQVGLADQLAGILGHTPPAPLVAAIYARSGGNPFFAEELLAAWRAGAGGLPQTLRDALMLRAEDLPDPGLGVLQALAVLGRPASPALVAHVSGASAGETRRCLRAAVDRQLLAVEPTGSAIAFRHALLREALYTDLLPDEREALHREVAKALSEQPDPPAAELAHHAHAGGLVEQALRASVQAGLAAERLYAYVEASVHFERALACWGDVRGHEEVPLDRIDVLAHTAEAQRYAGDYERAIATCREALAGVDREAEPERAAALLERLGQYHYSDDEVPLACYDEALSLLPADPPSSERARVLAARGMALLGLSRHREARATCEQAVTIARACGADTEEASASAILGLALGFLGDAAGADAQLARARALAEVSGRAEDLARLQLYRAEVLRLRGDTTAALELMLDGARMADRIGVAGSFGCYMAVHAVEDLRTLGRWPEAQERLAALTSDVLGPTARLMRATVAARLAAARGDVDAAERELALARALAADGAPAESLPGIHAAAAELALWSGEPSAAVAHVRAGLAAIGKRLDALNTPVLHALGVRAYADLAERERAAADVGALVRARAAAARLVGELEALVLRLAPAPPPPVALAHLLWASAERARTLDDDDASSWREAAAAWDALGQPYEAAYARWRLGEALLNAGQKRDAQAALRAAVDAAATLGATPLRREIEALGRRARLDLASVSPAKPAAAEPTPGTDFGLTAREIEVLVLLAEGLTNRQIAARLFMAPTTAGVHVSHILAKLNARNRVEAAGIAHRHGLGTPPLDATETEP